MSGKKTPTETPRTGKNGNPLKTGNPGNKGGGRPPDAFKDFLARLRRDPKALAAFRAAALDSSNRSFGAAWKLAAEYDEEKPAEKKQLQGKFEVSVRFVRE